MSVWLKTLVVAALVVPLTAYVAGSLVASGTGQPADRGPVIIQDAPAPRPASPTRADTEKTSDPVPLPDEGPEEDSGPDDTPGKARVVTPVPTTVDDDDDDEADTDDEDEEPEGDDEEDD